MGSRNFFLKTIINLLIFQLIFGNSILQAAAVPSQPVKTVPSLLKTQTVEYTPDQLELLEAVKDPKKALPRLNANNAFNIVGQTLLDKKTGKEYSLEDVGLGRPEVMLPNGILQRKLTVLSSPKGILLTLNTETKRSWFSSLFPLKPQERFDHVISLPKGIHLVSSAHDNELCYFLLSDGTIKAVHLEALHLLYGNSPVPLYEVARITPEQGREIKDYSLTLIKRRYIPIDKSREGMLSRLDKNESTRLELLTHVHSEKEVSNLEENLETLRPIKLSDGLSSQLRERLNTQDPTLYAGDLAIVRSNGHKEIVQLVNRFAGLFLMGLQHFTLQGMWVAASADNIGNTKNLWALNDLGQDALAQLAKDKDLAELFSSSGMQQALAQVPKESLGAVTQNIAATFKRIHEVLKQNTPNALRDSFTTEMWLNDFAAFEKLVKEVKVNAPYNTKVSKLAFWLGSKWQSKFGIPALMHKVGSLLKWPLLAAGAASTGLGLESLMGYQEQAAAQLNTIFETGRMVINQYLPVVSDPAYMWDAVKHSLPVRVGLLASVLGAAVFFKPFSQHSVNKLITITGIKYLFSIPMIPPQRVLLGWLNKGATLKSLKNGVIPWGLLTPRWNTDGAIARAEDRVIQAQEDRSAEFLTALNSVAEAKGLSVQTLIQIIANNPNSAEAKAVESETGGNVLRQLKEQFVRNFIKGFANFQESTYRQVKYPLPDDFTSNYVMRSYWVDGLFTIGLMFMFGEFADPNKANELAYQPDAFLWTHRFVLINDLEQVALHLGVSGAQVYTTMSKKVAELLGAYKPAGSVDTSRTTSSRTAQADMFTLLKESFNLRNNNWATAFGVRSWNQCVTLVQGLFVVGMLLRLLNAGLEGKPADEIFSTHNFMNATVGQLYFIYMAPFIYRWVWAVHVQINKGLEEKIASFGEGFNDLYLELTSAIEKRDEVTLEAKLQQMLALYNQKNMTFSEDFLKSIKRNKEESIVAWANRILEIVQRNAPVPEKANATVENGYMLLGSVVTTVLATVLMTDSFRERSFWGDGSGPVPGVDLNHLNLWAGASSADSIPSLMVKSLGNILAVMGAGHLFNATWDTAIAAKDKVKYGVSALVSKKFGKENPNFDVAVNAGQKASGSWDTLSQFLGVKWLLGIRPTVKAGATTGATAQCAEAILESR